MRTKSMLTEEWGKGQRRSGTGIAELDGFLEGGFLDNTVTAMSVTGEGLRLEAC